MPDFPTFRSNSLISSFDCRISINSRLNTWPRRLSPGNCCDGCRNARHDRSQRHASARTLCGHRGDSHLSGRNIRPDSTKQLGRNLGGDDMQHASARCAARPSVSATLLALMSVLSALSFSAPGRAETFPERTIKIVVPFPAGGPTDVAARVVAQALSSRLAQNVVVENLTGGGGKLGAKAVATASPDGYTLLLGGTNVNAIPASLKNLGYDPIGSFAPVAPICADTMVLAVS